MAVKKDGVFRFKQFEVCHENCAMKVGTDGVLLGAWATLTDTDNPEIIDVGTGSGLIALMLAQRFPTARIYAAEIDQAAITQAGNNFRNSLWSNRLSIIPGNFFESDFSSAKYDLIVSNPPFFENSLVAPKYNRSLARHVTDLSATSLLRKVPDILKPNGRISLITPFSQLEDLIFTAAQVGLFTSRLTEVISVEGRNPVRLMTEFSLSSEQTQRSRLTIHSSSGNYTSDYINLTRDFYLAF